MAIRHQDEASKRSGSAPALLILLALLIVVFIAIVAASEGSNSGATGSDPADVISGAKEHVMNHLKDPTSVMWGKIWIGHVKDKDVACGYFNAKDSFGAYTGSQRFISGPNGPALTDDQDQNDQVKMLSLIWPVACDPYKS